MTEQLQIAGTVVDLPVGTVLTKTGDNENNVSTFEVTRPSREKFVSGDVVLDGEGDAYVKLGGQWYRVRDDYLAGGDSELCPSTLAYVNNIENLKV